MHLQSLRGRLIPASRTGRTNVPGADPAGASRRLRAERICQSAATTCHPLPEGCPLSLHHRPRCRPAPGSRGRLLRPFPQRLHRSAPHRPIPRLRRRRCPPRPHRRTCCCCRTSSGGRPPSFRPARQLPRHPRGRMHPGPPRQTRPGCPAVRHHRATCRIRLPACSRRRCRLRRIFTPDPAQASHRRALPRYPRNPERLLRHNHLPAPRRHRRCRRHQGHRRFLICVCSRDSGMQAALTRRRETCPAPGISLPDRAARRPCPCFRHRSIRLERHRCPRPGR